MNVPHILRLLPYEWERFARQHGFVVTRAGVILTPILFLVIFASIQPQPSAGTFQIASAEAFGAACLIACLLIVGAVGSFTVPRYAGAVFASERQNGVLPLLLLTRTTPLELLIVKALPPFIFGLYLILANFPCAVWMCYYLQVPWHTLPYVLALATLYLVISVSIGVMVSTWSKRSSGGVVLSQSLMLVFTLLVISPTWNSAGLNRLRFYTEASVAERILWLGETMALALLILGLTFAIASATIRREGYSRKGVAPAKRLLGARSGHRAKGQPIARLAYAVSGSFGFADRKWPIKIVAFLGLVVASALPMIGPILVVVTLQREATLSLKQTREQGVLDDIAMTPHSDWALGMGFLHGQLRAGILYVIAAFAGCGVMYIVGNIVEGDASWRPLMAYHLFALPVFLAYYVIALAFASLEGTTPRVPFALRIAMTFGFIAYLVPMIVSFIVAVSPGGVRYFFDDFLRIFSVASTAISLWLVLQGVIWGTAIGVVLFAIPRIGRNMRHVGNSDFRVRSSPPRPNLTRPASVSGDYSK